MFFIVKNWPKKRNLAIFRKLLGQKCQNFVFWASFHAEKYGYKIKKFLKDLRIPQPYAFWRNCGQKWSLGHFVIHGTTIDHFRYLWRHFKQFKKLLISLLLVSVCFFRDKNIVTVISIKYASKWWVTRPFLHNDLKNDQFGHFIRIFIGTSGLMIGRSQKQYFCSQRNKCFNLRYHSVGLSPHFLFHIITVRD